MDSDCLGSDHQLASVAIPSKNQKKEGTAGRPRLMRAHAGEVGIQA